MAEDLKQWIESKLGTGEVVEIIYMGGSHPGARRKLVLSKLEDNGRKVRCVEVGHSGISKSVMVDKILRIDTMSPDQLAAIQPEKTFNNLDELYAGCLEKNIPDSLALDYDAEEKKIVVSEWKVFKNGNRRKKKLISIFYQETVWQEVFTPDGDFEMVEKPAQKPWGVEKKRFSLFPSAAKEFMKLFKKCISE